MKNMDHIRNFCIVAHIDHGKSTLADRLMEATGTVEKRIMKAQMLDQMDIERERGITIKLQPVHMIYACDGVDWELNLIDTPGHVDFSYEVSRSLAACEGALLVVDATQGVQAQTVANLYLALSQDLEIIPVINKIDLPNADVARVRGEIVRLLGCAPEEILEVSAKTGKNIETVLRAIVKKVPPPKGSFTDAPRALIFDSHFDTYRGVVADVRVVDGSFRATDKIRFAATTATGEILDVGFFKPQEVPADQLQAGDVGYIVTGLKSVEQCRVGDTIMRASQKAQALPGYQEAHPMVYAGFFTKESHDYSRLRDAMMKLKLNDAALTFEPETSKALGFGFRCGFLGLLHLEITQERLRREYGLDIIVTVPSVAYQVTIKGGSVMTITSPLDLPDPAVRESIAEPFVRMDIVTPKDYLGNILSLIAEKRGVYGSMEYLDETMVMQHAELPLSGIIVDFYDQLKSVTSGYASMNYEFLDYRVADLERMDIVIAGEMVEALSVMVYHDERERRGREIVARLKEVIPRQMFEVKIQAVVNYQEDGKNAGGKIVASERLSAMRKDVTAKLYGGDVTRKRKLLEKQKKGKKRMAAMGRVDLPSETYLSILKKG